MDPTFPVKGEYPGGSSSPSSWQQPHGLVEHGVAPQPIEGLNGFSPPPFLTKTFDMVDDVNTNNTISWNRGGQSFVVWDPLSLSSTVLPNYFKHNNFSSFVRQLNTYPLCVIRANCEKGVFEQIPSRRIRLCFGNIYKIMDPWFLSVKEEYPGWPSSSFWQQSNCQPLGLVAPPHQPVEYGVAPRPIEGLHDLAPPPFLTKTFDMVDGLMEYGVAPRPIEGLHDLAPPPFLTKTFDMVDGLTSNHIISWSRGGHSFVVWEPHAFSTSVLPKYFKHNNFSSFVRQLNTYGFRKIDPDKWEFANEAFLEGQKHLLRNIRRRKAPSQSLPPQQAIDPCVEVGRFGLDTEIDRLKRDKQVLILELVKLRQQQQNTRAYLQQMELRLQGTEKKQQQMMSFLARAMQNPEFIHQLVQQKEKRKELEEASSKKRRRPIKAGESSRANEGMNPIKAEPIEFGDTYGFQVSELEALALEMQGFGKGKRELEEEEEQELTQLGSYDRELDDGFWEELLNEGLDRDLGMPKDEESGQKEEEDVNFLADRLGFLGSSPK